MAVVNKYIDANLVLGKLGNAALISGVKLVKAVQSFVIASTDDATSVYRVFKGLSPDIVVTNIKIFNDALTGASDVDVGAYGCLDYDGVGAVIDANVFADALNIASGNPVSTVPADCMKDVSIANREKTAWELFGEAQYPAKSPAWDLCLTMNAMTTGATGNVCVMLEYLQA